MSTDPALASRNAREPESLDKVTNPLVLSVAGEIQLPTYPCHSGRSNRPTVKELIDRIMLDAEHIIRGRLTGFLDTESKVSRTVA